MAISKWRIRRLLTGRYYKEECMMWLINKIKEGDIIPTGFSYAYRKPEPVFNKDGITQMIALYFQIPLIKKLRVRLKAYVFPNTNFWKTRIHPKFEVFISEYLI
jgi:hypothetical protein